MALGQGLLARAARRAVKYGVAAVAVASAAAVLLSFPWATDPPLEDGGKSRAYYEAAYASATSTRRQPASTDAASLSGGEQDYIDTAREAANAMHVPERIDAFVERFGLQDKRVLEVGAGSGLLQDAVADYTALDIAPSVRRFFHKPFVEASATDMPFPDNSFDALWSIWVLEHIPNPEKALVEMRRVVRPGGYIYLMPAFNVSPFRAKGYRVRPYAAFGWKDRAIKASAVFFESRVFHYLQYHQIRLIRWLGARTVGGPSRFRFARLTPDYDDYWEPDSDATCSFAPHELFLWFETRGDRCLSCPSEIVMVLRDCRMDSLTIQVMKDDQEREAGR